MVVVIVCMLLVLLLVVGLLLLLALLPVLLLLLLHRLLLVFSPSSMRVHGETTRSTPGPITLLLLPPPLPLLQPLLLLLPLRLVTSPGIPIHLLFVLLPSFWFAIGAPGDIHQKHFPTAGLAYGQ